MVSEDIFGIAAPSDKSKIHSSYVTFAVQEQRDPPRHSQYGDSFGKSEPLCLTCKGTTNPQYAKNWIADCEKWKPLKLPDRKRWAKCQSHLQAGDKHHFGKCQSTLM